MAAEALAFSPTSDDRDYSSKRCHRSYHNSVLDSNYFLVSTVKKCPKTLPCSLRSLCPICVHSFPRVLPGHLRNCWYTSIDMARTVGHHYPHYSLA